MKFFLLILSFSVFSLGVSGQCVKEPFALLELFTSEGCSSCPPTDEWFNETVKVVENLNVLGLAHHVDYFNGSFPGPCGVSAWTDPFSSPAATATQKEYLVSLKWPWPNNGFVPQTVIQGKYSKNINMPNGNSSSKTLTQVLAETPKSGVCLEYVSNDEGARTITFDYTLIDTENNLTEQLVYYIYEDKLYNQKITAGENCNLFLDHDRVRRTLKKKIIVSLTDKTGTLTIDYPSDAVVANLGVAAFVQTISNKQAVGGTKGFRLNNFITATNEFASETFTVTVYPNPTSEHVNFNLGTGMDYIEILDLTGKIVQSAYNVRNNSYTMDLTEEVTPGIYIFRVGSKLTPITPKTGKLIIKQ